MKELSTDMNNKINRHHLFNDIILIVILLLLATAGWIYLFLLRGNGDTVKVTVDGELYAQYSLSEDRVVDILTGDNGEQLNRLVICDGKAYIEEATCPDGICSDHSAIFRNSESIVCLPHRVVVTVVSKDDQDLPDIVV